MFSFSNDLCFLAVHFDDRRPLVNFYIRRTNIKGLMEGPHGLEVCRHERRHLLLAGHKIAFNGGHTIILVEMVLEDWHTPEPFDDFQALATNVQWVHQSAIECTFILFIFVIVERFLKYSHVVTKTAETNGCSASRWTVSTNSNLQLLSRLSDHLNTLYLII